MAINLLRTLVQAELGGWEGGYSHWEEREVLCMLLCYAPMLCCAMLL